MALTQEYIRNILNYDPNTGIFTWNKKTHHSNDVDDVVGTNLLGYLTVKLKNKNRYLHRLAFLYIDGCIPKEIDHLNGNRSDNRFNNLAPTSRQDNMKNKKRYKTNKSGCTGVQYNKKNYRWVARIRVDKKEIHLGSFVSYSDAVDARKNAEVLYGFGLNCDKE